MGEAFQIRSGRMYSRSKPTRDPLYLRFVKSLPCVACLTRWNVDPCHTGPHGIGQKSCNLSCIPLCRKHHQQFDADPRGFTDKHRLNVPALIARFNEVYLRIERKKAA
jgi:hypothetical protein